MWNIQSLCEHCAFACQWKLRERLERGVPEGSQGSGRRRDRHASSESLVRPSASRDTLERSAVGPRTRGTREIRRWRTNVVISRWPGIDNEFIPRRERKYVGEIRASQPSVGYASVFPRGIFLRSEITARYFQRTTRPILEGVEVESECLDRRWKANRRGIYRAWIGREQSRLNYAGEPIIESERGFGKDGERPGEDPRSSTRDRSARERRTRGTRMVAAPGNEAEHENKV